MMSYYRLVVRPSSPRPREDNRSIEMIPLSSGDEFESEPTEMRQKHASRPSLMMALCHTYIGTFLATAFLKLITDLLNFVGPLILK